MRQSQGSIRTREPELCSLLRSLVEERPEDVAEIMHALGSVEEGLSRVPPLVVGEVVPLPLGGIGDPRQEILVTFRQPPHTYAGLSRDLPPNTVCMGFEDEHLQFGLNVGGPFDSRGRSRVTVSSSMPDPALTAYGSVIRWILEGDPTFTVRGDGVEEGWRITEEVLAVWADQPLLDYPAGSSGPV
ncbi:MAG TPA: hypothetical protein GXZ60_00025 [Intrasporangiaceae bacterium]|nr:hypothetical protein [Intrasporangiaceae bacterium]